MSSEKNKKRNRKSDDKGSGCGCCGMLLGCGVILIGIGAVLIGIFVVPFMRENNWSLEAASQQLSQYRTNTAELLESWKERIYSTAQRTRENGSDTVEEWGEGAAEKVESAAKKVESVTEKAVGKAKKRVKEYEEPTPLPGAEDTGLRPLLIED